MKNISRTILAGAALVAAGCTNIPGANLGGTFGAADFLAEDMARLAGAGEPDPIDVARRFTLKDPEVIEKLRRWMLLNDED